MARLFCLLVHTRTLTLEYFDIDNPVIYPHQQLASSTVRKPKSFQGPEMLSLILHGGSLCCAAEKLSTVSINENLTCMTDH